MSTEMGKEKLPYLCSPSGLPTGAWGVQTVCSHTAVRSRRSAGQELAVFSKQCEGVWLFSCLYCTEQATGCSFFVFEVLLFTGVLL